MWQECPICKGIGQILTNNYNKCNVCNGKKIISRLTGRPPVDIDDTVENENIKTGIH